MSDIHSLLSTMETRGWELSVFPGDWLNPGCGWVARLRKPASNADGYTDTTFSAETPHCALALLLAHGSKP